MARECEFCGKQIELGDEEDYYLWVEPNMQFDAGQLACLDCVNGAPGAQHEALYGKGDEGR